MYVVASEMERYLALCHVMRLCYRLQYELQVVLAHEALQAVLGIHLCTATIVMISATLLCIPNLFCTCMTQDMCLCVLFLDVLMLRGGREGYLRCKTASQIASMRVGLNGMLHCYRTCTCYNDGN